MNRTVLHIIYSLHRGGAERLIETYLRTDGAGRYEPIVCSLTGGGDLAGEMERAGARVIHVGKRFRGDVSIVMKLSRLFREENVDLLHLHNAPAVFWGASAAVLHGGRVPIVITEHRPYLPAALPWIYEVLYPRLASRASTIICVSENARESYLCRYPRLADRYVTIYNGVRTDPFESIPSKAECREFFGLPTGAALVGSVGRLVPVKNHLGLLEAFRLVRPQAPNAHLAIAGEGALREIIASRSRELGIADAFSIIEPTSRIEQFYGALDVFALPSISEGLPLTLLESFAAGVPAVATSVGGVPEVIDHGENGYLVPGAGASTDNGALSTQDGTRELAERIAELLKSPDKASRLGENGKAKVLRLFTAERMVERMHAVYDRALGARSVPVSPPK
jgi:glycosyltransferase involved in cell wall biosynthesis